jgi:phospholipid/cholesterol/gamma-HCH transport system permease protein
VSTGASPASEPEAGRSFRIEHEDSGGGVLELRFQGKLALADAAALWRELRAQVDGARAQDVRLDLAGVESIDGGAMALLIQTKYDLETAGGRCDIVGGKGKVEEIVDLYHGHVVADQRPPPKLVSTLEHIGNATYAALVEVQLVLAFLGSMVLAVGGVLRRPRTANWRDVMPIMNRTGVDAVPIVVLINFLIGFVMGYQSAVQLKQFGANIYVADLVGLSITRELGPLMTAIIVCGRSGAAFAAELGTMKVSEEVDALRTMGFGPHRFLVFPRMLALFLVMPVLTLLGDLVGILGGLTVGVTSLDLTITGYLNETRGTLHIWDVYQGLIKCGVFAVAIGIVSCQQGLATSGGAEGVGQRTTASVVTTLFSLILIDAGFTVLFHSLHL